jgi:hypothetical protein
MSQELLKFIFKNVWLYFNHILLIICFLMLINKIDQTYINNRKYCIKLILTKLTHIHDQISNSVENILMHKAVLSLLMPCLFLTSYNHDIPQMQSLVIGRKLEPIRVNKSAFRGQLNIVAK